MNSVKYLIGSDAVTNAPLPVYSEEAMDFLADLSSELLHLPDVRAWPDVVSAAFWCRRANIEKHKSAYPNAAERLGRGLVFHIAPSNIPVNFAFSYFFALLAGNASIVRVPSKQSVQTSLICDAFERVLPRHAEVARRTAFVTYPIDEEITAAFCAQADARMIWGGDRTVASVRRLPVKPRCIDVVFPDRYSACLLNGEALQKLDGEELGRLAERFYNDTYLMDQNACSSPQLIFWLGGDETVKTRFWESVLSVVKKKYLLQAETAVDKYEQLCEDAIDREEVARVVRQGGNMIYRAQLKTLPPADQSTSLRGRGGYFYEYELSSIRELGGVVTDKYQTLTCFGVDPEDVRRLVAAERLRGIDRIVPIGSAMDIDSTWDGYDIITMLSRIVQTG